MCQVADGLYSGHPGAAFQGVNIPLEFCGNAAIRGIFGPGMQRAARGVDQIVGFFQENADQLRIQVGEIGNAFLRLGTFIGSGNITLFRFFHVRERRLFFCRFSRSRFFIGAGYAGNRPRSGGVVHIGLDFSDQIRRRTRKLLGFQVFDHAGETIVAAEQQVREFVVDRQSLFSQPLKQVFQFVREIADGRDVCQPCAALEGMQVPLKQAQDIKVGRILAPVLERFGGAVDEVAGFFQEDFRQFLIHFVVGFSGFRERRLLCGLGVFTGWCLGLVHLKTEIDLLEVAGEFLVEGVRFLIFRDLDLLQAFEGGDHILAGFGGKTGCHLVHHVDQLFMSGADSFKESLVRRLVAPCSLVIGFFQCTRKRGDFAETGFGSARGQLFQFGA